ncbi:DUF4232 domain-containing protein [Streptomyces zaomyceticus]|uniref:DUF4232 domain-containing protein n=1 Tax=Streptomyces zaomyceticus TaxID=68286 RepID=UPI0036998F61
MSGRTTRTRLLAATTLAVATLSLTACGSGAAKDEGAALTSTAPTGSATQPAETPAATPTGDTTTKPRGGSSGSSTGATSGSTAGSTGGSANGGSTGGSTGGSKNGGTSTGTATGGKSGGTTSAGSSGSGGSGGANSSTSGGGDNESGPSRNKQCGAGNTKTTATPVARPLNHMLLTVTNTGSGLCDLLGYPVARFGEAQSVPPVIASTHPQAVVTLAPGASGYAGVILSAADGSGQHGYTTTSLTVGFTNGTTASPRLAGKGVYVDSSLRVTYWQSSMDDALN